MSRLGGSKDKGVVQVLLFEPRRRFGGSHGPGGGPEEFTKSRELTARGGVPGSGGGLQEQAGGGHGGGGGSNE